MPYNRTPWKDHVAERPNTYVEVTNADGSVTHNPAPGEVVQQGTPQSATNFNNIENGIQYNAIAFDWLYCIVQAQARETETLKAQVTTLAGT